MNPAGTNPDPQTDAPEYYVLKSGNTYGPFLEGEIEAGLETGQFTTEDFVQVGGQSKWESIGSLSGEATEAAADAAPPWDTICKTGWLRLRSDIDSRPFEAGGICLLGGAACMILANWPVLFWIPWFAVAAATGAALLRRKQVMNGAVLFLVALCIPLAIWIFPLKRVPHSEKPLPVSLPAAPKKSLPPPAAATPAPPSEKAAPESIPGLPPGASAAPKSPATANSRQETAPVPAPVAAVPHYARQAPVTPVARFSTPAPIPGALIPGVPVAAEEPVPSNSGNSSWWSILTGFFANSKPTEIGMPGLDANGLANAYTKSLVLAKGDQGSGSGFVCKTGAAAFLYTNIHVVAKINDLTFTRPDDVLVAPGRGELAAGRDVARFEVPAVPQKPLEMITNFENNVRIGDAVVVLGNSGGGGVVTVLTGVINGIGPDRIEVSAQFIPGNSGSPIVHVNTGKVIGIATYLTLPSNDSQKIGATSVRRFGYRIDNVATWERLNWPLFQREAASVKKITATTEDLFAFVRAFPNEPPTEIRIESLRRDFSDWKDAMQTSRVRAERISATERFLREVRFLASADISAAQQQLTYAYFRGEIDKQKRYRDRITAAVDKANSEKPSSLTSGHL